MAIIWGNKPKPGAPGGTGPYNPGYVPPAPMGFSFGKLTPTQDIFYNDPSNRSVGWQMLKDYLNRSGNGRYNSYLDSLMGTEYNRYLGANAQVNGKLDWTDWMTQHQNQYPTQWQGMSTVARGGNPGLYGNNQVFLG
jgi:hypothetical protein